MYVRVFLYSLRSELTVLDGGLLCMPVSCYYSLFPVMSCRHISCGIAL